MNSKPESVNPENEPAQSEGLDFDPLDEIVCTLLSQGWSYTKTATEVGCATKTVQRRMSDPVFAAEVRRRCRANMAATTARLVYLTESASDHLARLLNSENEWVCLQAIRLVMDTGHRQLRAEGQDDLLERLAAMEATVAEQTQHEGVWE